MSDAAKTLITGSEASRAVVVNVSNLYDMSANALEYDGYRPIHAGDDYGHDFTAEITSGSPYNISKVWFTIKHDSIDADADALLQYDSDTITDIEITDGPNGAFTLHIQAADTADLEGTWFYDIQILTSGGNIVTVARGNIEFLPNITRAVS